MRSRTVVMVALLIVAGAAAAQDSPLQRCRTMTAAAERLACYDAIPLTALPVTRADASAAKAPKVSDEEIIETSIAGRFTGWWPKDRITMTNGQVWQVIDGSTGATDVTDSKVKIRRGFIGGYRLDIEGVQQAPRVHRVQ